MEEDDRVSFIQQMPKIELHAHLSGSISKQTVRELINLHQKNYPEEVIPPNVIKAFAEVPDKEENSKNDVESSTNDNVEENQGNLRRLCIFSQGYEALISFLLDEINV